MNSDEMSYFKRLKEEKEELSRRISALRFFIRISPKFGELSAKHKSLLCLQLDVMEKYLHILNLRIEDIEKGSADDEIHK